MQPKTKDLSTRLWGINTEFVGFYSPEPRAEVYCFRLNFNISKLVYWSSHFSLCPHTNPINASLTGLCLLSNNKNIQWLE